MFVINAKFMRKFRNIELVFKDKKITNDQVQLKKSGYLFTVNYSEEFMLIFR